MNVSSSPPLDLCAAEIEQVASELNQLFAGRRIERFVEASPTCLLWQGPITAIAVDCTPHFVHLCATDTRKPRGEVTPFTMLLRKHIGGTPIARIAPARPHDRVVHVEFISGFRIACELTGRHANVFLVDPDGVILGSFFPPHSVTRPLHAGVRYSLPPKPATSVLETSRFPDDNPSAAIDSFFLSALRAYAARRAHHQAVSETRREIARIQRTLSHLEEDAATNAQRERGRKLGELFLQVIPFWPAQERTFSFTPYAADSPVELTLPATCQTPAQAAQWHFQQYKKSVRANKIIQERISLLQSSLQQQQQKLERLLALDPETFEVSAPRAKAPFPAASKKQAAAADAGIRQFTSSDGFAIRVGKSAADNHRLTFQIAKGSDTWLHARDVPGAHVVVSCPPNTLPPARTLQEAAMLALFYSDARSEGRGYVHAVPRKFVRPVPRRVGEVTLSSPKSLYVELDEAALSRLFSTRN